VFKFNDTKRSRFATLVGVKLAFESFSPVSSVDFLWLGDSKGKLTADELDSWRDALILSRTPAVDDCKLCFVKELNPEGPTVFLIFSFLSFGFDVDVLGLKYWKRFVPRFCTGLTVADAEFDFFAFFFFFFFFFLWATCADEWVDGSLWIAPWKINFFVTLFLSKSLGQHDCEHNIFYPNIKRFTKGMLRKTYGYCKKYEYTGVPESVLVPLPGPPYMIHYPYWFNYRYFKSFDN